MEIMQKIKRLYQKRLKRKSTALVVRFFNEMKRRTGGPVEFHFIPEAYYITMGIRLLSPKPYKNWHAAYKAAKAMHSSAFFCKGNTLARHAGMS